jgi:hypothetical protein
MVMVVVALTYLLFNSSTLPVIVLLMVAGADLGIIIFGHFIFTLATDTHLISKEFLEESSANSRSATNVDGKFWAGMRPIRVWAGFICSFETKEFLLFIWGDVVISTLIDLLIAKS